MGPASDGLPCSMTRQEQFLDVIDRDEADRRFHAVRELGGEPRLLGIVGDQLESLRVRMAMKVNSAIGRTEYLLFGTIFERPFALSAVSEKAAVGCESQK